MNTMRIEKAPHAITVGTPVSIFSGGRKCYGVVAELGQYEGSGLVIEGGLLLIRSQNFGAFEWEGWYGWGAVTVLATSVRS